MWRSIRIKLVVIHLLLIVFALELIGAYFVQALNQSLVKTQTQAATRQAQLIATLAAPEVSEPPNAPDTGDGSNPNSLLQSFPQLINGTVYVLNKEGVVRDTSAGMALIGQKRVDSLATQSLVSHKKTVAIHDDPLTGDHLLTVVVPILVNHTFAGLVESVSSVQNIYTTMRQVTEIFYSGSGLVLCLTALLGIFLSRTIARPVLDVTQQARKLAAGDFTQRVQIHSDDEFGQLAEAINDLTDKLEDAIASNQHQQERLQAVIRHIGDGVAAFDKDLALLFCNDAAQRLVPELMRKSSEAPAELLGLRNHVHPTSSDAAAEPPSDREPDAVSASAEWNYILPHGDSLLQVHVTPIRKSQRVEGYVALLRDVTEQEKIQASRRDFVANVSHELKTPLTSLKSYLEALQSYQDTDEATRQKFLSVMENEVNRMVRLTQDLLQLAGLERRTEPFRAGLISVSAWVDAARERFQLQADRQGVRLYCGPHPSQRGTGPKIFVQGDRDMLDRLLDNLLSNALKYTARGGEVSLTYSVDGERVRVAVADSGIGIPETDLPRVFERFYTVDKARTRRLGGTGLGLAIAREIAERHGGKIAMESVVGEGTTVHVDLPAVRG